MATMDKILTNSKLFLSLAILGVVCMWHQVRTRRSSQYSYAGFAPLVQLSAMNPWHLIADKNGRDFYGGLTTLPNACSYSADVNAQVKDTEGCTKDNTHHLSLDCCTISTHSKFARNFETENGIRATMSAFADGDRLLQNVAVLNLPYFVTLHEQQQPSVS